MQKVEHLIDFWEYCLLNILNLYCNRLQITEWKKKRFKQNNI